MAKAKSKSTNKATVAKASSNSSKATVTPKEQAILNAISTLKARSTGDGSVDRAKAHKLAGYTMAKGGKESKSFVNALTILRKHKELIVFDSKTIDLTPAGEALAEPTAQVTSRDDEIDKAIHGLTGKKAKDMMGVLRDCGIHTRETVAHQLDYANAKQKGFVNLLSIVKGAELIQYVKDEKGNQALQLAAWLLEAGE